MKKGKTEGLLTKKIGSESDLQDYFHEIHNYIRDNFGLYGKSALQFFNFFFVLRRLDDTIKADKLFIDSESDEGHEREKFGSEYSFSNILEVAKKTPSLKPGEKDFLDLVEETVNRIARNKYLDKSIFMLLPVDIFAKKKTFTENSQVFVKFMEIINRLFEPFDPTSPVPESLIDHYHVSGRVYEYFLGFVTSKNKGKKSGAQMEDLGQFYSARLMIRYIIALVDPSLDSNGNVPKMADFFCGSGGFISEYVNWMNMKYKTKPKPIDWTKQIDNLFGADTDTDICKSARVDIMYSANIFSECCNGDNPPNFIRNVGSSFEADVDDQVMFNLTNPPYAGNKLEKTRWANVITKTMETYKLDSSITDKEKLAWLSGMGCLLDGGTYAGILKEGNFFDANFADVRKILVENYVVKYVISVPSNDAFMNTSTKTSILIYSKIPGKKTEKITFIELDVIEKDGKAIGLRELNPQTRKTVREFYSSDYSWVKCDGDYMVVPYVDIAEPIITYKQTGKVKTKTEVKNYPYSFSFRKYIKDAIKCHDGFRVVKLGDILKYREKNKHLAGEALEKGKYRFYTSSDKIKCCNFLDYDEKLSIIIGTGGIGALHLDDTFSCSSDNFVLYADSDELTTYIYYYLKGIWKRFTYLMFNGSIIGHITKSGLENFEIPVPESIDTIKLYLDFLAPANSSLQSLQSLQSQREASICAKIKLLSGRGKVGIDYDEYKLGDVCTVKAGKYLKKHEPGIYPIIGGGDISGYTDHFSGEDDWVIHKDGISKKIISQIKGKYLLNHHGWNIVIGDDYLSIIGKNYIGYYILSQTDYYMGLTTGSIQQGLNQDTFYQSTIKVLKPHLMEKYGLNKDFEFMDKLKDDIQQLFKDQEEFTKQMMALVLDFSEAKPVEIPVVAPVVQAAEEPGQAQPVESVFKPKKAGKVRVKAKTAAPKATN